MTSNRNWVLRMAEQVFRETAGNSPECRLSFVRKHGSCVMTGVKRRTTNQAAALWRRASDVLRASARHTPETFDLHAQYQAAADECDRKDHVDMVVEHIARTKLDMPTLRARKSDSLDFHEVSVWGLKRALAAAYEAGREDAR